LLLLYGLKSTLRNAFLSHQTLNPSFLFFLFKYLEEKKQVPLQESSEFLLAEDGFKF